MKKKVTTTKMYIALNEKGNGRDYNSNMNKWEGGRELQKLNANYIFQTTVHVNLYTHRIGGNFAIY